MVFKMKKHNIENIIRKILPIIIVCSFVIGSFSVVYADEIPTINSKQKMIEFLRDRMCDRDETFSVEYVGDDINNAAANEDWDKMWGLFQGLLDDAVSEDYAVANYQGDYLKNDAFFWEKNADPNYSDYVDGKWIVPSVKFTILNSRHVTNHEQQQYVEKYISDTCNKLGLYGNKKTSLQKVKTIHDYICKLVKYDYEAADHSKDSNFYQIEKYRYSASAYGAIKNKRVICQGYSHIMYAFCREVGIPVRMLGSNTHAWNIVSLDGGKTFYNIDVTWDDDGTDKQSIHDYFLKSDSDMQEYNDDHFKNPEFKTSSFTKKYPIPNKSYAIYKKVNGKNVPYCPYCNQKLYGSKNEHLDELEINIGKVKLKSAKRIYKKKKGKKKRTNKVKLKLSKVKNITGYQIHYDSSKKDLKNGWTAEEKTRKSTKTSLTIKSWYFKTPGKMYIKVRGYKKVDKKYFYGPWSNIKKIK